MTSFIYNDSDFEGCGREFKGYNNCHFRIMVFWGRCALLRVRKIIKCYFSYCFDDAVDDVMLIVLMLLLMLIMK